MVDNTSIATKSALQAAFSSASSLPLLVSSPGAHGQSGGGGGMKLEAVMENLQRQQAARLALEEKLRQAEKEKDIRSMVESQIQQQALAFRHYQAAVRGAFAAGVPNSSSGHPLERRAESDIDDEDDEDDDPELDRGMDDEERDMDEDDSMNEGGGDEDLEGPLAHYPPRHAVYPGAGQSPKSTPIHLSRVQPPYPAPRQAESPSALAPQAQSQHHEWTYEEQFKQSGQGSGPGRKLKDSSVAFGGGGSSSLIQELYELDDDEKRKEFLDDLFSFMQKRGTPVNRIPIMAKQVLDLYTLYKLVTEKGGLVEVINKKIWREITKGLNLPTSITSAAFTLRTQYMKYLYPYECEKRGLSSPGELQAAIDSNRREGRRQSYGSTLFNYSPVGTPTLLASPKLQMPHISMPTPNGGHMTQTPGIKKEDSMLSSCLTNRVGIPMSLAGHHSAAQAAAAAAVQAAALEQLREKLESGEPPEKKVMLMAEEQQRIMQHALQQNLFAMATQLPMNIKLNNRDDRQETALNLSTNGISSINMSIEINGVVYTGVLFARKPAIGFMPSSQRVHHQHSSQGKSNSPGLSSHIQPSSSASSSASSHGPATSP
ncbi:AT-rich interactive domain-containing protein 3A isoform X2 [Danio rerio]|uniref:AT-rich interactive domain-containing protein 3 n=5 Tax=Danio rerio TaxID=7955 RepID=A0A0R4IS23_DANRE|nr:AT-rich interactive domain-containing protein 3A isoform X1 [Danio rerio]|eukprot:XP_005165415.1 AT-rich interactive domain-containing protein 3A isoform X1 [Danio rerio]